MAALTDAALRDPERNLAHYRDNAGYERSDGRLKEVRTRWMAGVASGYRRVLDVGCVDGFLAELLPDSVAYTGIELNSKAIAGPYPKAIGKVQQADAATFDYPPDAWDCIVLGEILEHVPDPIGLLRRVLPALAPGGRLISTSANGRGEAHEPGNREHLREWTVNEFRALHVDAGYEVESAGVVEAYRLGPIARWCNAVVARRPGVGP